MKISTLGINKGKIKQFNSKGIYTVEDLVKFLPKKYYDFRKHTKINDTTNEEYYSIVGEVKDINTGKNHIRIKVSDNSGKNLFVTWFNQKYVLKMIKLGEVYNFCGKIQIDQKYGSHQMLNPMFFSKNLQKYQKIIPVYSKIKGMSNDYLLRSINTALALVDKKEYLDKRTLKKFNLMKRKETIEAIHQPKNMKEVEKSKRRLLFDDLYYFAKMLHKNSIKVNNSTSINMSKADTISNFIDSLPFDLTNDQIQTIRNIFVKIRKKEKVNALIQGDVGSGKTIIAFILMLIAAENKYQSALMAPTNVLAKQHYEELKKIGKKMGYKVGFLSGEIRKKEKNETLKEIKNGNISMVVGTHAVIAKGVDFNNLGLTIVDEEHRFGVVQREKINEKSDEIHQITMSATPIPRSLALTIYGEGVDVYNINQMPKGRKKIKTALIKNNIKAYKFMEKEINKGKQCYVVCPLIDKSNADVMEGVLSANETYEKINEFYKNTNIKTGIISGNMKQKDVSKIVKSFSEGDIDILVSTTIIEVGVNVPNSTVMLIQNAERFGLAQLHQLRGRVGRGNDQSYCILISEKENNEKLKAMTRTSNGFKIAKFDLKLRGAGDFLGTKQSGDNKYIMLMLSHQALFNKIRKEIKEI